MRAVASLIPEGVTFSIASLADLPPRWTCWSATASAKPVGDRLKRYRRGRLAAVPPLPSLLGQPSSVLPVRRAVFPAIPIAPLFCAASDIDHAAVGVLASVMQSLEIRGLISREHSSRYALTDDGRAVLRAMSPSGHNPPPALRASKKDS